MTAVAMKKILPREDKENMDALEKLVLSRNGRSTYFQLTNPAMIDSTATSTAANVAARAADPPAAALDAANEPRQRAGTPAHSCHHPSSSHRHGLDSRTCKVVLFAAAVYTTVVMMIEVGRKKGIMDYSLLTESVFGAKVARVLDFCIALSNMGALLTYFNVIGFLGSKVVRYWSGGHIVVSSYSGFLVLVALLDLPLVFLRSYGELTPISAGSLLFITFAVFFVAIQGQIDARDDHFHTALPGPRSVMDAFEGLGTISYGITCQAVVFEAYQSTKRADKGMFLKGSMALATAGGGLLLTLMAIWGYAAFGQDSESNIFANFNVDDVAVQVAMLVVVLHLALYIPNDFIIMRLFVVHLYDPRLNVLQLTPWVFRAVTLALYAIPVAIMASVPSRSSRAIILPSATITPCPLSWRPSSRAAAAPTARSSSAASV